MITCEKERHERMYMNERKERHGEKGESGDTSREMIYMRARRDGENDRRSEGENERRRAGAKEGRIE